MHVSLIATVYNEGDNLHLLLDSILAQTHPPDEVVISDGGSRDNTVDVLKNYQGRLPLKIVEAPGANISEGRNAAIKASTHEIIAVTDGGVRLAPDWLKQLISPFEEDPNTDAVAGFFEPDPQTPFEVAMGATVLPIESDVDPERFMPSSRSVAFRREAWDAVGGYPEWLDYGEDLIFDFRLVALYGPFTFEPDAIAFFRPRRDLAAFFRQYYYYARGDGKADLFITRHMIRYLTYFGALPSILAGAILVDRTWLLALIAGAFYMFGPAYRRLFNRWGGLSALDKLSAVVWVPIIRVAGDLAKMMGYPGGRIWRILNNNPQWRLQARMETKPVVKTRWQLLLDRDAAISDQIDIAQKPGPLRGLAIFLTRTGDGLIFFILLAILFLVGDAYWRSLVILWLIADFATGIVVQFLKSVVRRPRPVGEWGKMYRRFDPHSFPSGHSARGGVLTIIGLLLGPPVLGAAAAVWGLMIALSRITLGVHYASDVAFGYLLGMTVAWTALLILR